jgi:hypothetical protein
MVIMETVLLHISGVSHVNLLKPSVTSRTTGFNIKKLCIVPTLRLRVLCVFQKKKQQLLPYKTLRDWFL